MTKQIKTNFIFKLEKGYVSPYKIINHKDVKTSLSLINKTILILPLRNGFVYKNYIYI